MIVTAGGKQALANAALAVFGPGDEVITHVPGWPTIVEQIKLADATPVIVRTSAERRLHAARAAAHRRDHAEDEGLHHQLAGQPDRRADHRRRADEAGAGGEGEGPVDRPRPLLRAADLRAGAANLPGVLFREMRERTIVCGSASKGYSMTGWRCGWTVGPKEVIAACGALQSHQTSNVCSITQKAVVAALTGPQDCVTAMLRRVPQPPRPGVDVADRRSAHQVRQAGRRLLPVHRHHGAASPRRHQDVGRVRRQADRGVVRGDDGGGGVRRAGLPAHLLRQLARAAARKPATGCPPS